MSALISQLAARGYRSRSVAIHHLRDSQEDFESRLHQGLLEVLPRSLAATIHSNGSCSTQR